MDHRGSRNTLSTNRTVAASAPGGIRNRSPEASVSSIAAALPAALRLVSTRANFTGSCAAKRLRH
jgi:hypothetical protein